MSSPIRILRVFGRMNKGGAETVIMNLYRNIDRSKLQFDFIVHTEEKCDYDDEIRFLGGLIYHVPRYTVKNHIEYKKKWIEFFNTHKEYKLIHADIYSTASIFLKIAKNYGLITIAHSHSTSNEKGINGIIKNALQKPLKNIADYLFACSESAGLWLFGKDICKKDNFFIVKTCIDTKKYHLNESMRMTKRIELRITNRFVIGHVGRFETVKNHVFLIHVFKLVSERFNDIVLLLIGDGELKEKMKALANKLGVEDKIIFAGLRDDIPDLLSAMDLFVFPSLFEGLSGALIEAQASGLDCLVSDTITKENAATENVEFIKLQDNESEWAEKILKYANTNYYRKSDNAEYLKKAGFDVTQTAEWLQNFYLRLVDN